MEAKELMIGDWYDWYADGKNYHYQVTKETFSNDDTTIANFEPIPLTADILKKNGCTMVDKGDYGEWHIKDNPNIPLWQHTEFIIFGGIEIHYVHELQHALRLCGLNDLADNFKIE